MHIVPLYCSSSKYNISFYKQFALVMNALDNKSKLINFFWFFINHGTTEARSHVNRLCLAADIPLIESGSSGYLGQVTVIKKVTPFII